MKEQFVTYEIALKLKELGFDEDCIGRFFMGIFQQEFSPENYPYKEVNSFHCPLWQQVIDWLREKHNLCIEIQCPQRELSFYSWTIHKPLTIDSEEFSPTVYEDGFTNDYYKSREQAILKCIELCKNKE